MIYLGVGLSGTYQGLCHLGCLSLSRFNSGQLRIGMGSAGHSFGQKLTDLLSIYVHLVVEKN